MDGLQAGIMVLKFISCETLGKSFNLIVCQCVHQYSADYHLFFIKLSQALNEYKRSVNLFVLSYHLPSSPPSSLASSFCISLMSALFPVC